MMRVAIIVGVALVWATTVGAEDVRVNNAYIPIAPPGVMSHAAYLTIENTGVEPLGLIGVQPEGYGIAHLHKSEHNDGVATMAMLHQLDIAPGQTVSMAPGGLHIMLMRPERAMTIGDTVTLTLSFANGEDLAVTARIEARGSGS